MKNLSGLLAPLELKSGRQLPNGIIPGPMEGIMGPLFCKAFSDLGLVDCWMTPFIRISGNVPSESTIRKRISPFTESALPVTVQLLGNETKLLTAAAERLSRMGITGINLNFACPSKKVLSTDGGGKLLLNPPLMAEIISSIKKALPGASVSVKLRSGFDSHLEMREFLPLIRETAPDFIILHWRTVKERYAEIPEGYKRLKEAVKICSDIPIIASGDIFTVQDATKMVEECGCRGISPARGLLKDPFLIKRIKSFLLKEVPPPLSSRKIFFRKMLETVKTNPEKYSNKGAFMEMNRNLFGENHRMFRLLKKHLDSCAP